MEESDCIQLRFPRGAINLPSVTPEKERRRWEENIKMDLGEVGWGDVDWIGLAQDRNRWRALVNSVLNLRVPRNAGKLSSSLIGFSSSA
jgi:hypothetical protein